MPSKPPKACSQIRCPNYATDSGSYCTAHRPPPRPKPSAIKRERDKLYNSAKWRNYRRRHLMTNPMCTLCLEISIAEEARHLDHIIPRGAGGPDYPTPNGVRGLCHSCHSQVTAEYLKDPDKFIKEACIKYGLPTPT